VASKLSPFLVNFGQGVSPQGQKVKRFCNAHLIDRLRDQAEILQDGEEAPAASLRQVWHHQNPGGLKVSVKIIDSKYLENGD